MPSQLETDRSGVTVAAGAFAEYGRYDGIGLGELVRSGQVSPLELVEAALDAVDALNPALNAICHLYADEAREIATGSLPDGPFRGVPFLIKDIGAQMAGKRCDFGSRLFAGAVASQDSELTRRFRDAGVVIIGKTTTPELGAHVTTEPVLTGPTRNPWSLDHSSGGSSGGSSSACAAGIVPIAHANDGLGSIRIPASKCHLFGLKPTRQRVPTGPDQGETGNGRHCEFIVSRSVRDSAVMLDMVSGADVGAPYWAPPPARPYRSEIVPPFRTLRIAVMDHTFTGAPVHADCAEAVLRMARLCETLGHEVEAARPDFSWDEYMHALRVSGVTSLNAAALAAEQSTGRKVGPDTLEPFTMGYFEEGARYSAADLHVALQGFGRVQRAVAPFFERYDVLLTPILSTPPARIGELMAPADDFELYWSRFAGDAYSPFCGPFNVTGQPAASIPALINREGLPIGNQLVAPFGREDIILALAAQLEQAAPWADNHPPHGIWRVG